MLFFCCIYFLILVLNNMFYFWYWLYSLSFSDIFQCLSWSSQIYNYSVHQFFLLFYLFLFHRSLLYFFCIEFHLFLFSLNKLFLEQVWVPSKIQRKTLRFLTRTWIAFPNISNCPGTVVQLFWSRKVLVIQFYSSLLKLCWLHNFNIVH